MNVSSNQSFTNNMTFINQMSSSMNPQRSNIQSAVVIDSDEEDEVLISNPNLQQNNPMQTNFQSGNHVQLNSPMQRNMQGMNQQQSNPQIQNNMQLNQFQGNVQFQNSNPTVANQVLPNGLNMFHPANRFMQNANRNQQLTMQNTIKTEASTQPLLSPSQIKQQPDMQFNNAGSNNTFQQQLTPTMGNPQQIQRSLSMPSSVNMGQQQPLVKSENVDESVKDQNSSSDSWRDNCEGIEPVNSDQSLQSGDSGELPADAKWQDYCETMESFIDGNRANVSFRCKICSSTIAQKSNFARHFNQHKGTPYECPICSKVLNRTDYIERHLKQHGVANPEKLKAMIKIAADTMKKK